MHVGDKNFSLSPILVIHFNIQNYVYNPWKNYFDIVVLSFVLTANLKIMTWSQGFVMPADVCRFETRRNSANSYKCIISFVTM
jgi:hypothetical protein